jgi:hypothetical protein
MTATFIAPLTRVATVQRGATPRSLNGAFHAHDLVTTEQAGIVLQERFSPVID